MLLHLFLACFITFIQIFKSLHSNNKSLPIAVRTHEKSKHCANISSSKLQRPFILNSVVECDKITLQTCRPILRFIRKIMSKLMYVKMIFSQSTSIYIIVHFFSTQLYCFRLKVVSLSKAAQCATQASLRNGNTQ